MKAAVPTVGTANAAESFDGVFMTRKLLTVAVLSAASLSTLFAVGCSSQGQSQPYSLTGKSQDQIARDHEQWRQKMMYTDDKGHYHPELAAQGRPLRYIA